MLKAIIFENLVHFKDKTFIEFKSKQSANCPRPCKNKETVGVNRLNIFVGANFCGKSTVLELIRRCMTEEINVSITKSFDKNLIAYAFCLFGLDGYEEVISGIIKEPGDEVKVYKIIIFTNKQGTFLRLRSSDNSITYNGFAQTKEDIEAIQSFFRKEDRAKNLDLLEWIKCSRPEVNIGDGPSWNTIERKYVSTLPLRGIGMVQWTRSEKIKESNYTMASKRAEVISDFLLNVKGFKDEIKEKDEKRIFQYITHPEIFEFKTRGELIYVQHYNSTQNVDNVTPKEFPLLKTSEGILEAKLTSLLLAHKYIETLCLEDPDRGMHPQMTERLKTMLYREAYKKTIIVVTHSPYLIDTVTIDRTHVFFRKKTTTDIYECSVRYAMGNKKLSKVSDIETLRTLLFANKVLLVEGVIDREVVEGIFTHIKRKALEKETVDDLNKDITTYQVIPVHGCENTKKIRSFCEYIHLKCLCLWDLDKVVKFDKETKIVKEFMEIEVASKTLYDEKYGNGKQKLSSFINGEDSLKVAQLLEPSKKNTFIWRHGAIEDAILSCNSCNEKIRKALHCKNKLNPADLKNKLNKRLHEENRKKFYAEIVEVKEIDRFLTFIKEKEGVENEENHSNPQNDDWKHSKSTQYNCCNIMNVLIILIILLLLIGVFGHKYVTSA